MSEPKSEVLPLHHRAVAEFAKAPFKPFSADNSFQQAFPDLPVLPFSPVLDNCKGQLFQFDRQIHIADRDRAGKVQQCGGEVQNSGDPGAGDLCGGRFRLVRRDGENGQFNSFPPDNFREFGKIGNPDATNVLPDQLWIAVKSRPDRETLSGKSGIPQKRLAQMAATDQGHGPRPSGAENFPNPVDQLLTPVSDTAISELSEPAEIPADLRIGQPE